VKNIIATATEKIPKTEMTLVWSGERGRVRSSPASRRLFTHTTSRTRRSQSVCRHTKAPRLNRSSDWSSSTSANLLCL